MATEKMVLENNIPVTQINYPPNGTDHTLQKRITDLMDTIVSQTAKFTLAELGYLHINTLTYNKIQGTINLRVYFDVHYAARAKVSETSQKREIVPVEELKVFEGYLYVGNLTDAITYERVMAPPTKAMEDELHRASLRIKDSSKYVETDALVLNCNLPITMAAAHNHSLTDPEFRVQYATMGKGGKKAERTIITSANMDDVPLSVTVNMSASGYTGYNPDDAIPYLTMLLENTRRMTKNRDKIRDRVKKDAKKGKKARNKQYEGFNEYA